MPYIDRPILIINFNVYFYFTNLNFVPLLIKYTREHLFVILALEGQTLQETLRYISRKVVLIQGRIK